MRNNSKISLPTPLLLGIDLLDIIISDQSRRNLSKLNLCDILSGIRAISGTKLTLLVLIAGLLWLADLRESRTSLSPLHHPLTTDRG